MNQFTVIIAPFAKDNIREAYDRLTIENPIYAAKWLDDIEEKILGLRTFPESHAVAPENDAFDEEIRQLLYGRGTPWRIFFTIDEATVHVLHVRHGSRDYWSL
ncbi:MAG: type II toxin-antitoxin system RelE/ParE family toxin [Alphaproteobacteria bacterium]|nr:MAG: type II toxin-antitoxin system RelE/ParE family toxin [Alphaproteobacteria bacterium]